MRYIYTLSDPTTLEIRYVGITNDLKSRFRQHVCISSKYKTHTKTWIKSLIIKDLQPIIEIIDICNIQDSVWLEQYWISQIKTWGFNLTNHTIGGEGTEGYKHTEKAIEKIRISGIGRKPAQKSIDALINYNKNYRTSIHCKRLSLSNKGRVPPNKGVSMSEEQKLLLSKIKLGKPALWRHISVIQLSLNGEFVKEWSNATEAAKTLNLNRENIVACLKGRRKKCGNYIWVYKNLKI